jgi:arylsulfatase A-like enzyme
MILKVPGKTNGQRSKDITEFIDIYPTLSDLAGLPITDHLDGESLVPSINGEQRPDDFAISKFHDGVTIVKGNYFYTEFLNKDNESKASMLFDHATDPLELDNLAEKEALASTVDELHTLLRANWGDEFFVNKKINSDR